MPNCEKWQKGYKMDCGLNALYVVGLTLLTAFTFALLILKALPIILAGVFEIAFQILSIIAQILAMFESKPKRRIRRVARG